MIRNLFYTCILYFNCIFVCMLYTSQFTNMSPADASPCLHIPQVSCWAQPHLESRLCSEVCTVHVLGPFTYMYICTLFGIKTMLYLRNRHALVSLNTFYIPLCLCILRLTRCSLQMKMSIALTVCFLGNPYFVHFP